MTPLRPTPPEGGLAWFDHAHRLVQFVTVALAVTAGFPWWMSWAVNYHGWTLPLGMADRPSYAPAHSGLDLAVAGFVVIALFVLTAMAVVPPHLLPRWTATAAALVAAALAGAIVYLFGRLHPGDDVHTAMPLSGGLTLLLAAGWSVVARWSPAEEPSTGRPEGDAIAPTEAPRARPERVRPGRR